jgi:hypothetical protein
MPCFAPADDVDLLYTDESKNYPQKSRRVCSTILVDKDPEPPFGPCRR